MRVSMLQSGGSQPTLPVNGHAKDALVNIAAEIGYLSLAARLAIHRLAWLVGLASRWEALDAHLRPGDGHRMRSSGRV